MNHMQFGPGHTPDIDLQPEVSHDDAIVRLAAPRPLPLEKSDPAAFCGCALCAESEANIACCDGSCGWQCRRGCTQQA